MELFHTTADLTAQDRQDHILTRLGYRRMQHRVAPGLYSIGAPDKDSPVLVTANYSLSFDALRSSLKGVDAFIMVLDTKGINVWCAAGKGTFGTEEVVRRVQETGLSEVVSHRKLILPQLGAPGVNANEVKKRTGFHVEYGPIRAADVKEYMRSGATAEMRRVRFPWRDRAVLIPVELKNYLLPLVVITSALALLGQLLGALMVLTVFLSGIVLFPLLLPILPTKEFSSKGIILGILMALPFSVFLLLQGDITLGRVLYAIAPPLLMSPWVGYISLNFTGCSTYTSRTGVRREIFRYIPVMALLFITGAVLAIMVWVSYGQGWLA
jgi:hypothetical protein